MFIGWSTIFEMLTSQGTFDLNSSTWPRFSQWESAFEWKTHKLCNDIVCFSIVSTTNCCNTERIYWEINLIFATFKLYGSLRESYWAWIVLWWMIGYWCINVCGVLHLRVFFSTNQLIASFSSVVHNTINISLDITFHML